MSAERGLFLAFRQARRSGRSDCGARIKRCGREFSADHSRIGMALAREVNLLAYRPGLAVGAVGIARPPHRIVLRAAKQRTVKIRTTAGEAVADKSGRE